MEESAASCSCPSSHFHAHPSLRSLLLQLHHSVWIFLSLPCCLCSFPPTGYGIWLLWSISASGMWVNFPHTIQDTIRNIWNIFIYFWYLQAVEEAPLSQCPSLQRFFFSFFLFSFFFFFCGLSGIIKRCDCFVLPSTGIYPTHKYKTSSPQLCFHPGRVGRFAQWCSEENQEPRRACVPSWLFSKTQIVLLRSIKICLLTFKNTFIPRYFHSPFCSQIGMGGAAVQNKWSVWRQTV